MNKKEFVAQYVVQFIASYKASTFNDSCMSGDHQRQADHSGIIIEAIFHAEAAWQQLQELDFSGNCITDPREYFSF